MANRSMDVQIGRISSFYTAIDISVSTNEAGEGSVCFSSMDCGDGRKAVHHLIMDTKKYAELKLLIAEADVEIEKLRAEGYLKADQLR